MRFDNKVCMVTGGGWLLLHTFAQAGLPAPSIAVEVNAMSFRRELLSSADWLTYGPRQFFRRGGPRPKVVEIPVKALSRPRHVSVYYRKDAYLSPAARRFIEILKVTAKTIVTEQT